MVYLCIDKFHTLPMNKLISYVQINKNNYIGRNVVFNLTYRRKK